MWRMSSEQPRVSNWGLMESDGVLGCRGRQDLGSGLNGPGVSSDTVLQITRNHLGSWMKREMPLPFSFFFFLVEKVQALRD